MCRLVAYLGIEIPLENIVVKPKHSLLEQSQDAQEAKLAVNGDGFGLAWYDAGGQMGIYKDVLPAWSDANLASICKMVRSGRFIAHVRASTSGATSRENCHPFGYENWSFAHNGGIGNFDLIRRKVEGLLSDAHYAARRGNTDSELFFLLMLTNGLAQDVAGAVEKTTQQMDALLRENQAYSAPIRLTAVFSDGDNIYGFRHASDDKNPSLYLSECLDHGGRALASEPLHGSGEKWTCVAPGQLVQLSESGVEIKALRLG